MSTKRARGALKLFEEALELSAEQREKWLSEVCDDDRELCREVQSLLSAHSEADDFLESAGALFPPYVDAEMLTGADVSPGRKLGDFVVEKQIGAGGMGVVFRAHQVSLNRPVALKVLPPYLRYSESARTRFGREIEAAARLQHRNIVAVYTTGDEGGAAYYAMELIEGPSLSELVSELRINPLPEVSSCRGALSLHARPQAATRPKASDATPSPAEPRPPVDLSPLVSDAGYFRRIAQLMADVATGLDYAHRQQVIHRDVKPSNLLFSADGEIHVSDFGLARIGEQPGLTRTGEMLGTPFYMAPEQVEAGGVEVDHRTDIYSLGATLYEVLTLRPPFLGESRDQVTSQIAVAEPVSPRSINRRVPVDLETICLKAIEKSPRLRYQTAAAMADDLRSYVEGRPIAARPTGRLVRGLRWASRRRVTATVTAGVLGLFIAACFFAHRAYLSESRWTDAQFDRVYETAQFAAMQGDLARAGDAIDEAEQLGASDAQLKLLRGQLALQSGVYQRACDLLQQAVEQMPGSVAAHALLFQALNANEQNEEMTRVLGRLEQLEPVTLQDYLLLGQAKLYNDYNAGIALLDEAVRQDRTNVVARLVRGSALIHQANISAEAEHAEAALDDLRTASEFLEKNAYIVGRTLEARLMAATAYGLSGDEGQRKTHLDEAERLAAALEEFPDNYRSHRWRAFYFDYVGDDQRALESWRAMKQTRIAFLVIALFRLGELDEALELCDQRLERYKGARFTQFFRALVLSARVDNPSQIVEAFKPDGKETLDTLNAHRFHYVIFCLAGKLDEAQDFCRRLQSSNHGFESHGPWWPQLLDYTCGDIDGDSLLELSADSRLALVNAHFVIGVTQLAKGNRDSARRHFAASAELKSLSMLEGAMSRALLAQLAREPSWPAWIPAGPKRE